jgi:hypothetical protein
VAIVLGVLFVAILVGVHFGVDRVVRIGYYPDMTIRELRAILDRFDENTEVLVGWDDQTYPIDPERTGNDDADEGTLVLEVIRIDDY